jgi:hypothetical protein
VELALDPVGAHLEIVVFLGVAGAPTPSRATAIEAAEASTELMLKRSFTQTLPRGSAGQNRKVQIGRKRLADLEPDLAPTLAFVAA